ncbi:hypothetical protein [Legionella sp.]|uniref:hypothetical protein n=1 Tax=Legionella sp. TaxID=459 RepID=UPI003CB29AA5
MVLVDAELIRDLSGLGDAAQQEFENFMYRKKEALAELRVLLEKKMGCQLGCL